MNVYYRTCQRPPPNLTDLATFDFWSPLLMFPVSNRRSRDSCIQSPRLEKLFQTTDCPYEWYWVGLLIFYGVHLKLNRILRSLSYYNVCQLAFVFRSKRMHRVKGRESCAPFPLATKAYITPKPRSFFVHMYTATNIHTCLLRQMITKTSSNFTWSW